MKKILKQLKILIAKGLKIDNTSELIEKNINRLIEYLDNEGKILKKQHFNIVNYKKLEKTEEIIEEIKTFINMKKSINNINVNPIDNTKTI